MDSSKNDLSARDNRPKNDADLRAELIEPTQDGEAFWDLNLETKELNFSRGLKAWLGYSDSEALGGCDAFTALLHPDDREKLKAAFEGFLASTSETFGIICRMKHRSGTYRWFLLRCLALREQSGKAARIKGVHSDITELVRPYLESINYQSVILQTIKDAYLIIKDGEIIEVNKNFADLSGYTREDLARIKLSDLVARESVPQLNRIKRRLIKEGYASSELLCKRKDGGDLYVELVGTLLSSSSRTAILIVRDITEIKLSEKSLLRFQKLLQFIIEHNRNAVAVHDRNLKFLFASQPFIEMFNLQGREIIGRHLYEVFPDTPKYLKDCHRRVLKGEVIRSEDDYSFFNPGRYVTWECRPLYEDEEQVGGFILYIEDITERKRAEERLVDEKELFKTTLMSVADGIMSTDVGGRIVVMNSRAENLTGWSFGEARNRLIGEVLKVVKEESKEPVEDPMEKSLNLGKPVELSNTLLVSKSGAELPVEISVSPIKHGDGKISGTVFIIRDVSEKRAEQRKIEYLSYHDELTGLYNRRYMSEAAKTLGAPEDLPLAVFAIDVDGLKLANDAFGHDYGDQLLIEIADVLRRVCRPEDIIGRVGGDEFCIFMRRTDEREAALIDMKIQKEIAELEFFPIVASVATGFAIMNSPRDNLKTIIALSDHFMYQNKIKSSKAMKSRTIQMALDHNYSLNKHEQIHTESVSRYCEEIAKAMRLYDKAVQDIKTAGLLHDIGKIMIPYNIINKTEALTKEEKDLVKRHSEIGYQLLRAVDDYAHISKYVLHHHESWDGSGYPTGLKGEKIPLVSRIIAVADAFEAMTSERPYRAQKTVKEAVEELQKYAGIRFDPNIVRIFINKVLPNLKLQTV